MVYAFEFLRFIGSRRTPVVARVTTRVFAGDHAARTHALRILREEAHGGIFGCRILREDASIVATVISGVLDS